MNYVQIEGGVTAPQGFVAGATYAGVKNPDKKSEKPDVALPRTNSAPLPCCWAGKC